MRLLLLTAFSLGFFASMAQTTPYGSNDSAGRYVQAGDARIYYEVYGEGSPLVLLHGGVFGYIDEWAAYIPQLSKQYKVIAVALRGHGRSGIGQKPYTAKLLAEDVLAVLNKETTDSATVIGFSAGAMIGLYLAAHHPEKIKKLAFLGGGINDKYRPPAALEEMRTQTYADLKKKYPDFFAKREKLMPEPQRAGEWLRQLNAVFAQKEIIPMNQVKAVKCPVLIVGGDRDNYNKVEGFVELYRNIPNAQLAIINKAGHTDLIFNPRIMNNTVIPFLQAK
jgi:pimeloyl-ACP methyl ester carboxylesterase